MQPHYGMYSEKYVDFDMQMVRFPPNAQKARTRKQDAVHVRISGITRLPVLEDRKPWRRSQSFLYTQWCIQTVVRIQNLGYYFHYRYMPHLSDDAVASAKLDSVGEVFQKKARRNKVILVSSPLVFKATS